MTPPASFLITPLSRESIARVVITPLRVSPAKITATPNATPFSVIARLIISSLALLFALGTPLSAQNVGDFILPEKTASTGRVTNRYWPKGASTLWGTNSSSLPAKIVVGTGLSLSGSPLTLTATGGGGSAAWGDITGTLSAQTDLAAALALKAPLASPTFTGTVIAPNYTLSASESDTLTGIHYGLGWRDDRFTLQGPEGALQMYETGDPLESVLYWAGRLTVGSLEAAEITGEISGALVTSGVIPASVIEGSMTQPLSAFIDSSARAGSHGLTYANTGPVSQNEPTNPGTYYAQILVVDGDPDANYLEGRIRSKAQILADLDLEIGTDVQAYNANTSTLGSSIDLTSEVTGILPPANMGTGSSITTKYLRGDGTWQTLAGGGDATTTGSLDQFADVTQVATKTLAITESTTLNGGTHSGTNTGDQTSVTGNAGTATALQTARTINGTSFDGTANITVTADAGTLTGSTLASGVTASSLTSLGTIATGVWQGTAIADSYISSAATWNAKESALTFSTGLTRSTNTITVNTSQNIATLSNLTSNGFVKTSGGTGALSIDTATYQVSDADLDDLADGSLTGTLVAAASTSARGSVELATDGETSASVAVQGNDTRLVNAGKVEIGLAISDETTALTTGTAKLTFRMPHAMTVTAVRMSLTTVSSSGTPTVDINEAGTTILSTKLSCDASEKTSTTAATAAVISDSSLADDAEITIDIDTAGTGATGAKVWLIGTR